jgi:hypothetical protein
LAPSRGAGGTGFDGALDAAGDAVVDEAGRADVVAPGLDESHAATDNTMATHAEAMKAGFISLPFTNRCRNVDRIPS